MFNGPRASRPGPARQDQPARLAESSFNIGKPGQPPADTCARPLAPPPAPADARPDDERREFLADTGPDRNSADTKTAASKLTKAKLAKQETIEEEQAQSGPTQSCAARMLSSIKRKRFLVPLVLVVIYVAAVYCLPYLDIEPRIPEPWPSIPFNFRDGPLKPSSASQFEVAHLFKNQIHGPESIALDSVANMYLAIEGGFILYAHLNRSSPAKKYLYDGLAPVQQRTDAGEPPSLFKIAELNGIRQFPRRVQRDNAPEPAGSVWRRECQLDEQIYGPQLYSPTGSADPSRQQQQAANGDVASHHFVSHVTLSRCSKPLGMRLSPDEHYLYVIDTLAGLYRVNLRVAERPYSSQRLVSRLIDFRANQGHQVLAVAQLGVALPDPAPSPQPVRLMNVSMKAIDDLAVDYGAGTNRGDIIYMTVASQNWPAVSFLYDILEGRPSGLVLRFDTGNSQLVVLEPDRVAHVRTSTLELMHNYQHQNDELSKATEPSAMAPYLGLGAPRLDENDVFDDRPLHFPNGLELTDDRQALLIADTSNKRIIKHYVKGPRQGTSDLWAWTPHFPDNIRRGYDKRHETYWVVGCGHDTSSGGPHLDIFVLLRPWPRVRKFVLKNIYLFGWLVEWFGTNVLNSINVRDYGYSVKIGSSLLENGCTGMMILQYNQYGDVVRSIHSREFPNDLALYSQVNELIDANNQEHLLYLGSPSYKYVTKLTLPTESFDLHHQPADQPTSWALNGISP